MDRKNFITDAQNTWCPGCGNFSIQFSLKKVLENLAEEGVPPENIVLVSGIGCHAKIADYLSVNSFYAIHGRAIPVATGIKLANPDLTVICCAGDGDAYAEGISHLVFAAKRNIDITVIVHNNRVYGLTTGQYTPTSPEGFRGRSTPAGTIEEPFNPLELLLASGAGFVARGYTRKLEMLRNLIQAGIAHHGFACIDVLQICASYCNLTGYYDRLVYELSGHDTSDFEGACKKTREWDYNRKAPIGTGLFYKKEKKTFEEQFKRSVMRPEERKAAVRRVLESKI